MNKKMTPKKTMIFLHGKGAYKDHPKYDIFGEIAEMEGADLIGINALFPHTNSQDPTMKGFRWHNLGRDNGPRSWDEHYTSYHQIFNFIGNNFGIGQTSRNLIFAGHSQGAALALYYALCNGAQKVISVNSSVVNPICGYEISQIQNPDTSFPVIWIQSAMDNLISEQDGNPQKLIDLGVNVIQCLSQNSAHDDFDRDILSEIRRANYKLKNER